MFPFPENLSVDLNLCVNCNEVGSENEIDIIVTNSKATDWRVKILNVKVVHALEYLYNISWNNFTDKLKKESGNNNYLDVDNDEKILLCKTCTPLVAENYRLQKNLESFSHSQSLLHLAKQILTSDSRNFPTFSSKQNDGEESNLVNQDEDVDNVSVNDFPFDDDGSGKEGCDENCGDDDIEIKFEPTPDLPKSHSKNQNELRVVLHKIYQPILDSILNRKKEISLENTSKKRKNSNKPRVTTKNCQKTSTSVTKVVSQSLKTKRKLTRKTANESNRERSEDNGFDDDITVLKFPKKTAENVNKRNGVKRKSKLNEKDNNFIEPNGEDSIKTSDNVDNDESDVKIPPKKRKRKPKQKDASEEVPKDSIKTSPEDVDNNESNTKIPQIKRQQMKKGESTEVPRKYECNICFEIFPKSVLLMIHKRTHRTPILPTPANPEEPFTCDLCGKVCRNYRNYKIYHLRREHHEKYYVPCHVCGKSFLRGYLLTHLRTVHLDEEQKEKTKMECKICGKKILKAAIKMHMKVHDEDREKFECETCGNVYCNKQKYQMHKLLHDPNPEFSCKICGKYFPGKYALQRHELRHDSNKPFACDICGKGFVANYILARHKVMHQEERPFQCLKCGKGFKSAEYLSMHDKGTHGGIKQAPKDYSCSICAKIFKTKKQLNVHTDADHDINNTLY